jgi:hypothetical protein
VGHAKQINLILVLLRLLKYYKYWSRNEIVKTSVIHRLYEIKYESPSLLFIGLWTVIFSAGGWGREEGIYRLPSRLFMRKHNNMHVIWVYCGVTLEIKTLFLTFWKYNHKVNPLSAVYGLHTGLTYLLAGLIEYKRHISVLLLFT